MNNFLFADLLEFGEKQLKNKINTLSAQISPRKKNSKLPQLDTEENNIRSRRKKKNLLFNDNNSNTKSALILVPDYIYSLLKWSTRNYTKQILYPGQIVYDSGPLPKVSTKAPEASQLNSFANFISLSTAKFYKHIVQVLCILNFNIDNKGADEPASFKEAIARHG